MYKMRFLTGLERNCIIKVRADPERQRQYQHYIAKRDYITKTISLLNKKNPSILFVLYNECS